MIQRFPIYSDPVHAQLSSSINNILHESSIFVTIDEHTLTQHYHPKTIVYISSLLVLCIVSLDNYVTTYIRYMYEHYILVITRVSQALKTLCALPAHPPSAESMTTFNLFTVSLIPWFCLLQIAVDLTYTTLYSCI